MTTNSDWHRRVAARFARRTPATSNDRRDNMTAKLKTTTYKHINVNDFSDFVCETYGRPYNFQQQEGCRERGMVEITVPAEPEDFDATEIPEKVNGATMGVSFAAWLARDPSAPVGERADKFAIELFWERNFYPHESMVINDLHARGLLDAGEYMIVIDW